MTTIIGRDAILLIGSGGERRYSEISAISNSQTKTSLADNRPSEELSNFSKEITFDITAGSRDSSFFDDLKTQQVNALEIVYPPSGWCAPKITIHDALIRSLCDFVVDESIYFSLSGEKVTIKFSRWWHRPIWWIYRMWKRLWKTA